MPQPVVPSSKSSRVSAQEDVSPVSVDDEPAPAKRQKPSRAEFARIPSNSANSEPPVKAPPPAKAPPHVVAPRCRIQPGMAILIEQLAFI